MTQKIYPTRGHFYTYAYICSKLDLEDSPFLQIMYKGERLNIQMSHAKDSDVVKNCPAFSHTLWEYIYTTNEWIPIFHYAGAESCLLDFVDIEPNINMDDGDSWWVTPKGSPREQYKFAITDELLIEQEMEDDGDCA